MVNGQVDFTVLLDLLGADLAQLQQLPGQKSSLKEEILTRDKPEILFPLQEATGNLSNHLSNTLKCLKSVKKQ